MPAPPTSFGASLATQHQADESDPCGYHRSGGGLRQRRPSSGAQRTDGGDRPSRRRPHLRSDLRTDGSLWLADAATRSWSANSIGLRNSSPADVHLGSGGSHPAPSTIPPTPRSRTPRGRNAECRRRACRRDTSMGLTRADLGAVVRRE